MSDVITAPAPLGALGGAAFDGYVRVAEEPVRGMITLRGDFAAPPLRNTATGLAAIEMPEQGHIALNGERSIAWMSPDELLVTVPYADLPAAMAQAEATLAADPALNAVDVSHARCLISVTGEDALVREVIAKLAPVDMAPGVFTPGMFRRSRLAQVAAAIWMPEPGRAEVVCFRSVADYVFTILSDAARPGSEAHLYA